MCVCMYVCMNLLQLTSDTDTYIHICTHTYIHTNELRNCDDPELSLDGFDLDVKDEKNGVRK